MLPYLGHDFYSPSRQRAFVFRKTVSQHNILQQRVICHRALSTFALYIQSISLLHPYLSSLPLSKCCPNANRMQRLGHFLPTGLFLAGGLVRLHGEDEIEGEVQPGCPHPFPLASDWAPRLE